MVYRTANVAAPLAARDYNQLCDRPAGAFACSCAVGNCGKWKLLNCSLWRPFGSAYIPKGPVENSPMPQKHACTRGMTPSAGGRGRHGPHALPPRHRFLCRLVSRFHMNSNVATVSHQLPCRLPGSRGSSCTARAVTSPRPSAPASCAPKSSGSNLKLLLAFSAEAEAARRSIAASVTLPCLSSETASTPMAIMQVPATPRMPNGSEKKMAPKTCALHPSRASRQDAVRRTVRETAFR